MPKSFNQLIREFEEAGRVPSFTPFQFPKHKPVAAPSGAAAARRLQRKRDAAESRELTRISSQEVQERGARINQLGIAGFKEFQKAGSPAGRRRVVREVTARQKQQVLDKESIEQQGRLELEELRQEGRAALVELKRKMTPEEHIRKKRTQDLKDKLIEAQTQKIISEPETLKFKAVLNRIAEGYKAQDRLILETKKQTNKIELGEVQQFYAGQLEQYKAALKSPTETTTQAYSRIKNTGGFRTVRDIALFYATRKWRGKALQEITELSAKEMGVSSDEVSAWSNVPVVKWFVGQRGDTFQTIIDKPLPNQAINIPASINLQLYGNREAAEQHLKAIENKRAQAAHDSGVEIDPDTQAMVAEAMEMFSRRWPDQPSTYEQLESYDSGREAVSEPALNNMNTQLGDLFTAGDDGSDKADGVIKSIGEAIGDYFGQRELKKQEENRKKFKRNKQEDGEK